MRETFLQAACKRLEGLWPALHGTPCPDHARNLVTSMLMPWGESIVPERPAWPSDIGDDHSPFEYSVAFGTQPDLRFLVEGQGSDVRRACLRLHEQFGEQGADLRRTSRLADLLLPETPETPETQAPPLFFLWHTVSLSPGPLRVKCYLNPSVRGRTQAMPVMRTAFERLGLPTAWRTFEAAQQQLRSDDVFLFCLDLEDTDVARVKVYSQPVGATAEDLDRIAQRWSRARAEEVAEFCRAITGSSGPYRGAPRLPSIYFSFTRDEATPSDLTVQIPIRYYVPNDAVARDRVCDYLRSRGLDTSPYQRALEAVTFRSLAEGRGLNAWVSLRTGTAPPLVTVYFAAELYRVLPPS
jgi:DMATS type aromatic prenyltransferase